MSSQIVLLAAAAVLQALPSPQRSAASPATGRAGVPAQQSPPSPAPGTARSPAGGTDLARWAQPLATLLGAMATASIAFGVMRLQRRRDDEEWYKNFRSVHADFWSSDPAITRARQMIANHADYTELRPLLAERVDSPECDVPPDRYKDLEALDRLFAVLVRMKDINSGAHKMTKRQRRLWKTAHYSYWITLIEADSRTELASYARRFWPRLLRREKPVGVRARMRWSLRRFRRPSKRSKSTVPAISPVSAPPASP